MNINLAYTLNKKINKDAKTPHERDLARMRMNILLKVKKRIEAQKNGNN